MTIKKRLLISNILMIIIPAIVGISATLGAAKACKTIIYRQFIEEINEDSEKLYIENNLPKHTKEYLKKEYRLKYDLTENYSDKKDKFIIISIGFGVMVLTLGSIFVTNRFLTAFVFKKIEKPIDILVEGVNQIREGNLDYYIDYYENDEFLTVCQNFNEMAIRLKNSVENTQKQEQSRKELIAGISHDIRTPLTSIKAYIEGLLDNVATTPQMQQKYMETIKQKANDMDNMVDKLFMFSKLDLGDYPFYPEEINIDYEINKILDENKEEYNKKGMNVVFENISDKLTVFVDPVQFRNTIINILENSLKYKDNDTVTVNIKCYDEDKYVKTIIEDNGPGVSEEAINKLFDVFYRSDPSRNNPSKGSGLGLAIASKIIEHFGGNIYAENIKPKGLRIVFTLPKKEDIKDAGENPNN
ncbi:MAG: sensor histidine kinase [Lachnospirales bacterium]